MFTAYNCAAYSPSMYSLTEEGEIDEPYNKRLSSHLHGAIIICTLKYSQETVMIQTLAN